MTPAASSTPQRVGPESSPEAMRAFAAAHLRPGLKPGDFLTNKRDYPTADTADVYRAVLDTLYVSKDGFPGEVVLYADAQTNAWVCGRPPCPLLPMGTGSEPKMETVDAYRIATLNRRHITPNFKYHIPLKLMGETEQREMEIDGRAIAVRDSAAGRRTGMREVPFWLGFQARYPHAWGYAVLSVVGMNPKKTEAILQVSHHCGTYCHSTETMVLWKVRGQWHVIERVPEEGDSTDLGNESLRYRGVGMHTPLNEIREAKRRDSVRQAELPRDIHGRITTGDGKPLPGAKIELHAEANPNAVWTVASDALGNYRFDGPPVGGAGLMVRCPQSSNRPDTLAAVTATDVAIGKIIEVNIPIDRAVCDDATGAATAQTIQPAIDAPPMQNDFDAARARKATYPSEDEAAVYHALLEEMGYGRGGVTPVYAVTRASCQVTACRDAYMRGIRYEPQVMLSTMENFVAVRNQRLDFRADFVGLPGMPIVGDSAIKAVERATSRGGALQDAELIHRAWPSVNYIVFLSPVGYSPRREQAIVEVSRNDSRHATILGILNRTRSGWRVVRLVTFVDNND
ncbi:MAG TPA: carboxypeptidase-like regulatory domain-containing protein [Gemmatimonadaceae bacterium]